MKPYFRMYCMPTELRQDRINVADEQLKELIRRPPSTRTDGWTLWDAEEVIETNEGLEATGYAGRQWMLLDNGGLEYWMPCLDETFQWKQSEDERKLHPWLYPYAVCELPVNFFRLAHKIYTHANLTCDIIAGMAFYSIKGFVLRPYAPGTLGFDFGRFREIRPFKEDDLKTRQLKVNADFNPDKLAFELVQQVYRRFGYSVEQIPCFDTDGNFSLRE